MIATFIGAVLIAITGGGIASMLFRFVLRRPTPKGTIPIAAGASVLVFLAYLEYTWFELNSARLPETTVVVETTEFSSIIQPWTLWRPRINGYLAVDSADIAQISTEPEVWATPMYNIRRYVGTREFRLVVNCQTNELVGMPLVDGAPDPTSDDLRLFQNEGPFAELRNAMCA